MNKKFLMICGSALLLTACASDDLKIDGSGNGNESVSTTFHSSTMTVNQSIQTRATSLDTWVEADRDDSWVSKLEFSVPSNAVDCTVAGFDKNANNYVVPSTFKGELNLEWMNLNAGASLYILGEVSAIKYVNYNGLVNFYIGPDAIVENFGPSSGGRHNVVNLGTLKVCGYNNIGNLYNGGDLVLERTHNPDWENVGGKADIPDAMTIYSRGGTIDMPEGGDLKATCYIDNIMTVKGDLNIQNTMFKRICGLEVSGNITLPDEGLITSYIKANEIRLNGHPIKLLPYGLIRAKKLTLPNTNSTIIGYEGSTALVEVEELYFTDNRDFRNSFSDNVYFSPDMKVTQTNQNLINVSVAQYISDAEDGQVLAAHLNTDDIFGAPACGPTYGENENPETPGYKLVPVGSIEAMHDHNSDKNDPNRLLSATSIDFANGVFYVSYHMRGDNYAGDTYDKDGVEGCIETWTMQNVDGQNQIVLGNYMWTNEFDFNHILIDGNQIVTVGHYGDKGAIIGKMANSFANFDASDGSYSEDFSFKYLTTDEKIYDDVYNPNQGTTTNQWVGYKNAGDGNCVIKVGNEYFVATYEGYGRLDSEFNRILDDENNVAFTTTPGSAKYLVNTGNEIKVLYLNERPETTATAQSSATLASLSLNEFPFNASTMLLNSYVSPVDGKNVLAWNGNSYFACLGKGGLNIDNVVYHYGEKGEEPVNGIAIDDDYIYLAAGSHLRVLDINNPENEIAHYTIPNRSANFIKVAEIGGEKYIAVAYGQAGVNVFQLKNVQ